VIHDDWNYDVVNYYVWAVIKSASSKNYSFSFVMCDRKEGSCEGLVK
jgi:hypothetical protein